MHMKGYRVMRPGLSDVGSGPGAYYCAIVLFMKTVTVPDLTPGYPSKGTKVGPAWTEAWSRMSDRAGEWLDGRELVEDIAPKHGLSPLTLRGILFRAAAKGLIQSEPRKVSTPRGPRVRTQFRVAEEGK